MKTNNQTVSVINKQKQARGQGDTIITKPFAKVPASFNTIFVFVMVSLYVNPTLHNPDKYRQLNLYMRRRERYVTPESFTLLTKPSELAFIFIPMLHLLLFLKLRQSDCYTLRQIEKELAPSEIFYKATLNKLCNMKRCCLLECLIFISLKNRMDFCFVPDVFVSCSASNFSVEGYCFSVCQRNVSPPQRVAS